MKMYIRHIAMALAIAASASSWALDLPVKTINGKSYYYYAVRRGDTILSVARSLGVTRDDIVKYNPSSADVLRQGTTLYLPVDEFRDVVSPSAAPAAPISGQATKPFPYKVQRGETLFGISHRFGITPDDIVAINPDANRGIKAGQTLMIPSGARLDTSVPVEPTEVRAVETAEQPAPPAEVPADSPAEEPVTVKPLPEPPRELTPVPGPVMATVPDDSADEDTVRPAVAILLPLSLQGDSQEKNARSATEFAKGFMLGLRSERDNAWPMDVYVYDNAESTDTIKTILGRPDSPDLSLLITSEAAPAVGAAISALGDRDTYVLNLMAVNDTTYLTDSRMMQYNVPHDIMYAKAGEALMMAFDGYTPVFLISKGGRSEKLPFTDYIRSEYASMGVLPLEIAFEGMLSSRELEELDPNGRYVFIPGSGSLTEFNKFARALITLREAAPDPSRIGVFGYPDWTIFRNDALESLHRLGAVIYSRFYADATSAEVKDFAAAFEAEYGAPMLEQVPSQALLGYDTARYVMANIRAGHGNFDAGWDEPFTGLQSTFMFVDAEGPRTIDGTANQAVYIIAFLPGDEVEITVL